MRSLTWDCGYGGSVGDRVLSDPVVVRLGGQYSECAYSRHKRSAGCVRLRHLYMAAMSGKARVTAAVRLDTCSLL
jgi:hypothetical protein